MVEFILVVGYIILTTFLGWYLTSRAKARNDINSFFVGKKELSWILVMFVMFGECIAGASSIGAAQTSYNLGLSSVWTNWGQCLGIIVFVVTVSKLYRTAGYYGNYSVPEAYQFRFGSQRCRVVVMAIVVIVYTILYALQPKAAAAILSPMLNVNVTVCAWVMAAVFVFQALSGLKGIAWMNVVHSSVLFIGCLVVMILSWNQTGGISAILETLDSSYLSITQPSLGTVVGNALGGLFAFVLSTSLVANVYGARSKHDANKGVLAGALVVFIFALFPAFIGVYGRIMYPEVSDTSKIFYIVADSFGPAIGAMASMCIIAAVFSTAPAFLLTVGTSLARDLYKGIINKNATPEQQLKFSKGAIVVLGFGSTYLGLNAASILSQVNSAFQIRAVAGLVLVMGALWKKVDEKSAFWSMLVGGIVAAGWYIAGSPFGIVPFWPGCGVALVMIVVMTLTNGYEISPDFAHYKELQDQVPPEHL
jgi:SSS family solute:Na+ symporter